MNRFTVNANLQTFADELNEKICGDENLAAADSRNEAHKRQRRNRRKMVRKPTLQVRHSTAIRTPVACALLQSALQQRTPTADVSPDVLGQDSREVGVR